MITHEHSLAKNTQDLYQLGHLQNREGLNTICAEASVSFVQFSQYIPSYPSAPQTKTTHTCDEIQPRSVSHNPEIKQDFGKIFLGDDNIAPQVIPESKRLLLKPISFITQTTWC